MRVFAKSPYIFFVLYFCLFLLFPCFATKDLVAQLFEIGMHHFLNSDYKRSNDYFEQIVDLNPTNDAARYYLALSLSGLGDKQKALKHASLLYSKRPYNPAYYSLFAQLQPMQFPVPESNDTQQSPQTTAQQPPTQKQSQKSFQQPAIESKSNLITTSQATKPTQPKATKQTKDDKKSNLQHGILKIDSFEFDAAQKFLQLALAEEPNNYLVYHYLGVVAMNTESSKAIDYFLQALEINPNSFETNLMLANSMRKSNELQKAILYFTKALEINNDPYAKLTLADTFFDAGDFVKAESLYNELYELSQDNADAITGLADVQLEFGFLNEAASLVSQAMRQRKVDAKAHYIKAKILLKNALSDEAKDEAKRAYDLSPHNNKFKLFYAQTLLKTFDFNKSFEIINEILKQEPNNDLARLALADALFKTSALHEAAQEIEKIKKTSDIPQLYYLLANHSIAQGNLEEAKTNFLKYANLSKNSPSALAESALFFESNGFLQEAGSTYKTLAADFPKTAYGTNASQAIRRLDESAQTTEIPQTDVSQDNSTDTSDLNNEAITNQEGQ